MTDYNTLQAAEYTTGNLAGMPLYDRQPVSEERLSQIVCDAWSGPDAILVITTSAEDKKACREADIIIDKDGIAHLYTGTHRKGAELVLEVEADNTAMDAATAAGEAELATVRDLIAYFKMQYPYLAVPEPWMAVLSRQNNLRPLSGAEAAGGGFAGCWGGKPGAIYRHMPRIAPPGMDVGRPSIMENKMAQELKDSLNLHEFVDRVVCAVSGNEGHFTSINHNDAGFGVSVGIRQWNQKAGELPGLLKAWHDKDKAKYEAIFGPYAGCLLNEKWVRNTNFAGRPGLMKSLASALEDKEFQDVQVQLARRFVVRGIQLALKYGLKSELAVAEIVDIANQKGFAGAEAVLQATSNTSGSEKARVHSLEKLARRAGGKLRLAALEQSFDPFKEMQA